LDGTGIPVLKNETEGRKGKLDGLAARVREVRLGRVFTQTSWDNDGVALRGAIENAEQFGDGAEWICNLARQHFPTPFSHRSVQGRLRTGFYSAMSVPGCSPGTGVPQARTG
jgi:hypothetical protein